jgi:cell division protein FtsW (lipid II flippase)
MKTILKSKSILVPIIALQLCGAIIFSTVNAKYLYGTDDNLFYFWRYGAFSLFGIIGGIACYFIPVEKINRFFSKTVKWGVAAISLLLYGLYWLDNNFYSIPHRISIWLDPYIDPKGAGYGIINRHEILQSAQIFGGVDKGVNAYDINNYILSYTTQRLGLVMFCIIIVIMAVLVIFMFTARKKITVPLCKFISFVIFLYITLSFALNITMTFNWLPVTNFHFPFISYDRFTLIFDLCMISVFIRMTRVGTESKFTREDMA